MNALNVFRFLPRPRFALALALALPLAIGLGGAAFAKDGPPDHLPSRGGLPAWLAEWPAEESVPFLVIHPPGERWRQEALKLASVGRRVRANLGEVFPHRLLSQVALIAFDTPERFAEATGIGELATPAAARGNPPTIFLNLERMRPMTPRQKEETFAHEFAHVFVGLHVEGGLPLWLDEGIAQAVAGEPADDLALASARLTGNLPPLRSLATRFPSEGASRALAYGFSRAATDYLVRENHPIEGLGGLLRVLADDQRGKGLAEFYSDPRTMDNIQKGWESQSGLWLLAFRLLAGEQAQWLFIIALCVVAYAVVKVRRRRQLAAMEADDNPSSFGPRRQEPIWTPGAPAEQKSPSSAPEAPAPKPSSPLGTRPAGPIWTPGAATESSNQRDFSGPATPPRDRA